MGKAAFAQPRYPQANAFNFMAVLAQEVEVASSEHNGLSNSAV